MPETGPHNPTLIDIHMANNGSQSWELFIARGASSGILARFGLAAGAVLGTVAGADVIHEVAQGSNYAVVRQIDRIVQDSGLIDIADACANNAPVDANNHCPEITPRIGTVTAPSNGGIYPASPYIVPNTGPMQTGTGELDITVFADANGNGLQELPGEIGLSDNISVVDQNGSVSSTQTNVAGVHMNLQAGRYRIYPGKVEGFSRVSTPGVAYDSNGNPFIDNVQVNPSAITTLGIGETNASVLLPPSTAAIPANPTLGPNNGSAPLPFGNAPLVDVPHTIPPKTTLPPTGMRSGESFDLLRILDFDAKQASETITKITINNQGKIYSDIPVLFAPPSVESVRLNGVSLAPMQTNHITREPNEMSQLPENRNNLLVTAHRGNNEKGQPMLGNLIAKIKTGDTFTVTLGGKEVTYKAISAGVVADARQDIKETDKQMVTFVTCDASLDWSTTSRVIVHAVRADGQTVTSVNPIATATVSANKFGSFLSDKWNSTTGPDLSGLEKALGRNWKSILGGILGGGIVMGGVALGKRRQEAQRRREFEDAHRPRI